MSLQNMKTNERQERMLRRTVVGAAAFLIALGSAMATAWLSHSAWLETLVPGFFYMKFNTSLAFAAGGIGLIAALRESKRYTLAAGGLVLLIGGVTLLEYLTGTNPGFDEWLLNDFHYPDNAYPGRMAPGPSLAFTCAGIYLFIAASNGWQRSWRIVAMELLSFLVFALGAEGLIGHLQSVTYAYSWGSYARMAPQAAAGFSTLGIGLMALAWHRQDIRIARIPLWVPALLCFMVLMVDISTPRGVAIGIVYVPLVFCALWFTRPHTAFVFAAIATILGVLALFAKAPSEADSWIVNVNRVIALGAVWFVAMLVYLRRKSERAFQQSENKLVAVINNVVDGLITINERGRISTFNPACERIFGYTNAEVIGRNLKMLMPEPYHGEHDGYLSHYVSTGEARIIGTAGREVSGRRKDGSVFPMDLSVSAFQLEDGRHFSGVIRDITARKEAERHLQESRERTQLIIDHALDAVITADQEGKITEWNKQAETIFGWPREEVIGMPMAELIIPPSYREAHHQGMQRFLTDGTANILNKRIEIQALNKQGITFPIELAVTAQKLHNMHYFTAFVRDITERKEAETNLRRYTSALERSNKELDDFAYIASHDLKEPLRGLFNNAKFLEKDYKDKIDAEGVGRLQRLGYLTQRMETLVNDLLYFSRLGRQELAIGATDLNAAIRDIESMMETTLKEQNAAILMPRPLPEIVCDKTRVTEIFRNLITNAVKYNDREKKIIEIGYLDEIRTKNSIEKQVFYVRDNGIGIEEEFYEEIFRIFKRLNEEDDNKKGTGVGLTFVRKIVDRHGGRIWLESEPGKGTTFYFTLREGLHDFKAAV